MSIEEYLPSEIEINSLGIGVNSDYLDLTPQEEYLVIGDKHTTHDELKSINGVITDISKKNMQYSMIVNNSGIGLNTTRSKFQEEFSDKSMSGLYIENGDIVCSGTIWAENIKLMNSGGSDYEFGSDFDPSEIVKDLITSINANAGLSRFTQGWNSSIGIDTQTHTHTNIFTGSLVNINAGAVDTKKNLHPLNIIQGTQYDNIEAIHFAIKNSAYTDENIYEMDGELIKERDASSMKIGILGNLDTSSAIISTSKNMPLEFHVSKFNKEINDAHNMADHGNSYYPSMVITSNGNISMGQYNVGKLNTTDFREPKLHVYGDSLLDNIYIKDKQDSFTIKHLDDVYVRKMGLNFDANQIKPGAFSSGNFKFEELEISRLSVTSELEFGNVVSMGTISASNLIIEQTTDISQINAPIIFSNETTFNNSLNIGPSGSLSIDNHRISALAINNIKLLIDDGIGGFTLDDGTSLDDDIGDKVALYYALNSNSGFVIDNSNLLVYGNISVGTENDQSYGNNKICINNNDQNRDYYEIGIYNNTESLSSIGHRKIRYGPDDESLIIKTSYSGEQNSMRNIYFYAGKDDLDIEGLSDNIIVPTLSILQNQCVGINTKDILDTIYADIKLNIYGSLLVNDIYIRNTEGNTEGITRALFFIKNNSLNPSYLMNSPEQNSKFFINYDQDSTASINFYERCKTFNINGGINITGNGLNDGYFENNIKLATFKILKNTEDIEVKTAYTNNNILIGLDDLTVASKNKYINNTISKPQLMLRNLSNKDYNDTIIRLYKGKSGSGTSLFNKAKYSGIDFCDWDPITGLSEKERWYIYRNYDEAKQTIDNYPGVFEIGYADNQYHSTKSGLEMMYRRNKNTQAVSTFNQVQSTDTQEYYFIFNRPLSSNLPISDLRSEPTVKIYGDLEVDGDIRLSGNVHIGGEMVGVADLPDYIQTDDNGYDVLLENNVVIKANKLVNITNNIINVNNENNFQHIEDNIEIFNTNMLNCFDNNKSSLSLTKANNNTVSIDFSTVTSTFDEIISKMKIEMEEMEEIYNEHISPGIPTRPTSLSIKNRNEDKLISFYNDNAYSYINIGHNSIDNYQNIKNIALHIEDNSRYLLQLTNTSADISPKINFEKKNAGINNDFWILDGPDSNNKFNIFYGNDSISSYDNINSIMTLTPDKKIGINNQTPLHTLDILSENLSSCRLINDYSNDMQNDFENATDFTVIKINNSNLKFDSNFVINNNDIQFDLSINIDAADLPNHTINSNVIYDDMKNNSNYIKKKHISINSNIEIPITFYSEITNYEINTANIEFEVNNNVIFNDISSKLELYNNVLLPSLVASNCEHVSGNLSYEFKVNDEFINKSSLNSNLLTEKIEIFNKYSIINSHHFSSNITNYSDDGISNIHIEFTNSLSENADTVSLTRTETLINTHVIEFDTLEYSIYCSNIINIYGVAGVAATTEVNVNVIVKESYTNNINLSIPYTLLNYTDIVYNTLYDYTSIGNLYTYNFITCNYLLKDSDILGGSFNISTNTNGNIVEEFDKEIAFSYVFNNSNYNYTSNIINKFVSYYEQYDTNLYTNYLYTNIIENVPHIILENTLNNNSQTYGVNKIYSTLDGDFKINYETHNREVKTLLNLNKHGNVLIDNGNLFVSKIFVEDIYNINTSNSIIPNNTNNFNQETYITTFSNLRLHSSSNIELTSKNIDFNIDGDNNSNLRIIKTGTFNNSNNKIIEIYCSDKIDTKLYNNLSLSKKNTTTYLTIGETSAKVGICKNIDELQSTLDINGNMLISKNNIDINIPHITLNSYNKNVILKKYNENLLYSDDGLFKLTFKNNRTNAEKELFRIDDNNMKINSDYLSVKNIYVENIFDFNGNTFLPGMPNYNNNDFFNFNYDLNIEASNIKFTTSNIDISLKENNNNYFNINKIRNKTLSEVLSNNYVLSDFNTNELQLEKETNEYYITLISDNSLLLYIYNTNNNLISLSVTDLNLNGRKIQLPDPTGTKKIKYNNNNKLFILQYNSIHVSNHHDVSLVEGELVTTQLQLNIGDYTNYPTDSQTRNKNNFDVTVSNGNYEFNDHIGILSLGKGTYYLNNIPTDHPLGFIIGDEKSELFEVELVGTLGTQHTEDDVTYYTGNIMVLVSENFGTINYRCFNHTNMIGEIRYFSFRLIDPQDIYITSDDIYIADNNNILKISHYSDVFLSTPLPLDTGFDTKFDTTFISNNTSGNNDGILNETAKIGIISSLVYDDTNEIIYLADFTNSTIRKIVGSKLETISGFVPNENDNNPRKGSANGNSYDTRYNAITKIIFYTDTQDNNSNYLIVLDSTPIKSRIIIIELDTYYSSTIYEIDSMILDFVFLDKVIYYLVNGVSNNIINEINITDITKYKKSNIKSAIFNNVFNITSVPYDTINTSYYNSGFNYSDLDGFITNMSVKTNNELTYVQFGSNNVGRKACIGISTEPVDNIDLKVGNIIETSNLRVLNNFGVSTVDCSYINTNSIDSKLIEIELNKHIVPTYTNIINFGSTSKYYNNFFIKNINISDSANSGLILNTIGTNLYIKTKNNNKDYGDIHLNSVQIYDDNLTGGTIQPLSISTKSKIKYTNSNLYFEFYNNNTLIDNNFKYNLTNKELSVSNLTVYGQLNLPNGLDNIDSIDCDNISVSNKIDTSIINVNNYLHSSNINCSNLTVYNDINFSHNLVVDNNVDISQNLYVSNYSFINILEASNINAKDTETVNLSVLGELVTNNITINGIMQHIGINNYETETLSIDNSQLLSDNPTSLSINHSGSGNVLDFQIGNSHKFILDNNCKLTLNDIVFEGNINNISKDTFANIANLDKDLIEKFQDSSNYTSDLKNTIDETNNIITTVETELYNHINKDFFKENPLHPIITEYNEQHQPIKHTYNDDSSNYFYTSDTSNFYIVLKNDTEEQQKHYQLSVTNNLLTDIFMVAGGGSGINLDIDTPLIQTDNAPKRINTSSDILGLSIGIKNIYYYTDNNIYYVDLIELLIYRNNDDYIYGVNSLDYNISNIIISDFKISKNEKVLLYSSDKTLYITNLISNTINTMLFNSIILKIIINSDNTYMYLLFKNLLKVIKFSDLSVDSINLEVEYSDMSISNDDNFLYILNANTTINIFNLKTKTMSVYKTALGYIKIIIDKYNENVINLKTSTSKLVKYNIANDTTVDLDTLSNNNNSQFDLTFDNSTIYYLKGNNIYFKPFVDDFYPAPGGAGGLLYRHNANVNQGVYDLYIGNGGITNNNGYNTQGFGVTVYGGGAGTLENNIPKAGEYKGYLVDNNYIIKNNIYENKKYNSKINNGGTSATNINNTNYYDGNDGYDALFLNNYNSILDLPHYFSGGSGTYPGLKGKGGGTNSRNIIKLNRVDLICDKHSGAGASGGYNREASVYPLIDGVYISNNTYEMSAHSKFSSGTINIHFELPTDVTINIYNSYKLSAKKYLKIEKTLYGEYVIEITKINPASDTPKYKITLKDNKKNIIYDSSIEYQYEDKNDNSPITSGSIDSITIKLDNIKYNDVDSDNKISYNDVSKGGSGLIILKYNIYNNPINNLQNEFNNRLKLLEENLLFSRTNTYNNENLSLEYFKIYNEGKQIFYDNIYIDQSYSGVKVVSKKQKIFNTVEEKYKYEVKLNVYILDNYNDLIPNIVSKQYIFETQNDIINFKDFIVIGEDKYIYIANIEIKTYDGVYNFDNNAYYSIINKNNNILTPSIEGIMPLHKEKFISSDDNTDNMKIINISEMSKYHILWSSQRDDNANLPINVFNDNDEYGEWKNNTYLEAGNLRTLSPLNHINNEYFGEWILIKFDRKVQLKTIDIDLGDNDLELLLLKIFGKNTNSDIDNSNNNFDIISFNYNENIISINNDILYYNTYIILFERINKPTLKIKNINFRGIYKNWEI